MCFLNEFIGIYQALKNCQDESKADLSWVLEKEWDFSGAAVGPVATPSLTPFSSSAPLLASCTLEVSAVQPRESNILAKKENRPQNLVVKPHLFLT